MFMSSRVLGRCLRCSRQNTHRLTGRHRSSLSTQAPNKPFGASSSKLRWYAFGALSASALGFWLWNASDSRQAALRPLSPAYFTPTTLTYSEKTNENAKLLRLTVPPEIAAGASDFQSIWSVYVKDSDIQVERPYTPLEGISPEGEMVFWIKKYTQGEVGRWLHSRTPGVTIEIRGPEQTWTWQDNTWDNVVMIAGGTGIAPFYQLLHTHFSKPAESAKTKFTLLQSYRNPKELPPPKILESLFSWERKNSQQLKIRTFVNGLDGVPLEGDFSVGRITKDALKPVLKASSGRTIVLICGPDPMINALAGPRGRDQSQGPVGGALGALKDGTFQVWKL